MIVTTCRQATEFERPTGANRVVANLGVLVESWHRRIDEAPQGSHTIGRTGGGSISLGNDGPDYGLVSAATFDTPSYVFDGNAFPFIKDSLTFEFTGATGLSESDISSVVLIFGTEVPTLIDTTLVPEPSSLLIFALLFGGWAAVARFHRRIAAQVHDSGR
ncbi:MAG: XDD4 family exosortase-dependent surface protein [Pirellulales bacterium]